MRARDTERMKKAFLILCDKLQYLLDAREYEEYVAVLAKAENIFSEYHVYDDGSYITVHQSERGFLLADNG